MSVTEKVDALINCSLKMGPLEINVMRQRYIGKTYMH